MSAHKLNRNVDECCTKTFAEYVGGYHGGPLSLAQQEEMINVLSNDSTPGGRNAVSFWVYFSTGTGDDGPDGITSKYLPTSVRNRVLYHSRLDHRPDILHAIYGKETQQHRGHKRKRDDNLDNQQSQGSRTQNPSTPCFEVPMPTTEPVPIPLPQLPVEKTPYRTFLENLAGDFGVIEWRVHQTDVDVIALNDINLKSAAFLKNNFIHVSRWKSSDETEAVYFCTCKMYSTVVRMEQENAANKCCHARFFAEVIEPLHCRLFAEGGLVSGKHLELKIKKSLESLNTPVVRLGSDKDYHRFSVLSEDVKSASLVTLQGQRISCKNGQCRALKGNTRKIISVGDPTNCQHIKAMDANRESWSGLCPSVGFEDDSDEDHQDVDNNTQSNEEQEAESSSQVSKLLSPSCNHIRSAYA